MLNKSNIKYTFTYICGFVSSKMDVAHSRKWYSMFDLMSLYTKLSNCVLYMILWKKKIKL